VHPPPSPARANFTLMTDCTPESSSCYSVYSVAGTMVRGPCLFCVILLEMVDGILMMYSKCTQENEGWGAERCAQTELEFLKNRTGPPGYIGWRIDAWDRFLGPRNV
jgi:hypothetical protein